VADHRLLGNLVHGDLTPSITGSGRSGPLSSTTIWSWVISIVRSGQRASFFAGVQAVVKKFFQNDVGPPARLMARLQRQFFFAEIFQQTARPEVLSPQ
jgi:hypothetical protein